MWACQLDNFMHGSTCTCYTRYYHAARHLYFLRAMRHNMMSFIGKGEQHRAKQWHTYKDTGLRYLPRRCVL